MIKIIALLVVIMISSCSPAGMLKRAGRLIKKAEQRGAKWGSDTIYIDREVITKEVKLDTLIKQVDFRDTMTVVKDRIVTKVKVDVKEKTVYVDSKCKSDTVKIHVPVEVTKTIQAGISTWDVIKLSLLIVIVAILLTKLFWK